jgi:hypothetical protein
MNTTPAYREAIKNIPSTTRHGNWVRTEKCCGVRELYSLPKNKAGIALTMKTVLEEGWTCLIYFGQIRGHEQELTTLKEFGWKSMGHFKSNQTQLDLEGLFFTRQKGIGV